MDDFEKHTFKFMQSTYAAINKFHGERKCGIAKPENKPLSNKTIKLQNKKYESSSFLFEIFFDEFLIEEKLNDKYLGLDEPLTINSQIEVLTLSVKSITNLTVKLIEPNILRGEITDLNSIQNIATQQSYYRLVVPIGRKWETTMIQSSSYTDKSVMYGSGLVSLSVLGYKIDLFTHNNNNAEKDHIIVESVNKITHEVFETICDSILKGLSVITGNWWGNQRFYLSSSDNLFKEIDGVYFKREAESKETNHKIIDPSGFRQYMDAVHGSNYKIIESSFPADCFSRLCERIVENEELNRAIFLVLEGNQSSSEILKSCSYLVAIETMAGLISKKNKAYFEDVQDSTQKTKLVADLIACLQNFKSEIDASQIQTLENKIRNIVSPSPIDKILKSYKIYGIDLSQHREMLQLIKSRNLFLHGKTPFKENEIKNKVGELQLNALRLNLLANILILKFCGYKGHIKNLAGWAYFKVNQNSDQPFIEPIYHII